MKKEELILNRHYWLIFPNDKAVLAFYYFSEVKEANGFGFNISDGGIFISIDDLNDEVEIHHVYIDIKKERDMTSELCHALKNDSDIFDSYKSNISVNIQDIFLDDGLKHNSINELADMAAERFLNFFISVGKSDE